MPVIDHNTPEINSQLNTPLADHLYDDPGPLIHPGQEPFAFDLPEDVSEGFVHNGAGAPPFPAEEEPTLEIRDEFTRAGQAREAIDSTPVLTEGAVGSPKSEKEPMSDEQRAAEVKKILAEDENQYINQNTLIFEYGPFQELERKLRDFTEGLTDENIAHLVTSHLHQCIHDAVAPNAQLENVKNTEVGILARIKALDDIGANMETELDPLLKKLDALGVSDIRTLRNGLTTIVSSEREVLDGQLQNLCPPTIGRLLFESLRSAVSGSSKQLVGNARAHRNKELVETLGNLQSVAKELKDNAGDENWERTQGPLSITTVETLSKRIDGLTKDVEDQVDSLTLRKGFNDVNTMLEDASSACKDPEHKSKLDEARKFISEFIKQLTDALGRLFSRKSTPSPS